MKNILAILIAIIILTTMQVNINTILFFRDMNTVLDNIDTIIDMDNTAGLDSPDRGHCHGASENGGLSCGSDRCVERDVEQKVNLDEYSVVLSKNVDYWLNDEGKYQSSKLISKFQIRGYSNRPELIATKKNIS